MKRLLILMTFSLLSIFSCKAYTDLSVSEFQAMLEKDQSVQLVDVRTAEEFAQGHLKGAVNIDWKADDFAQKVSAQLDKDRPVMLYCRSGRRSAEAAAAAEKLGFKTFNMKGGILAYEKAYSL